MTRIFERDNKINHSSTLWSNSRYLLLQNRFKNGNTKIRFCGSTCTMRSVWAESLYSLSASSHLKTVLYTLRDKIPAFDSSPTLTPSFDFEIRNDSDYLPEDSGVRASLSPINIFKGAQPEPGLYASRIITK